MESLTQNFTMHFHHLQHRKKVMNFSNATCQSVSRAFKRSRHNLKRRQKSYRDGSCVKRFFEALCISLVMPRFHADVLV